MKKTILASLILVLSLFMATFVSAGFDEFGYNRQARVFVGPASGWCLERGDSADCLGIYSNDRLVMKWNAEWDRGNDEDWTDPDGYDAWEDNEWNGMVPGGSGSVWHYKIKWSELCKNGGTPADGGYCIWGQFEVLMDQGMDPSYGPGHMFFAQATPNGYGN